MSRRGQSLRGFIEPTGYRMGYVGFVYLVLAALMSMFITINLNEPSAVWSVYMMQLMFGIVGLLMLYSMGLFKFKPLEQPMPKQIGYNILYGVLTFAIISIANVPILYILVQMNQSLVDINPLIPLFAPVAEEIVFRGFVMSVFSMIKSVPMAIFSIFVSAGAWTMFHYAVGYLIDPITVALVFTAGLAYGMAYRLTKSLDVPIIAHATQNILVYLS